MNIKSAFKDYSVHIENSLDFFDPFIRSGGTYFVIDQNVFELYRDKMFTDIPENKLYILSAAEENKTMETALDICERLTVFPEKRNIRLVSVGGGIV